MWRLKQLCIYLALTVLFLLVSTTGDQQALAGARFQPAYSERSIVVVDALNRTVVLDRLPTRVVSLAPSITEIVFYLGLEEYLIGVDSVSYNDPYFGINSYVKERGVADVGGYWWSAVNLEKILELKPDLVLADKGAHQPLLQFFEDYGVKAVYLNGGSAVNVEDVVADFRIVAGIYGRESKVEEFAEKLSVVIAEYRERLEPYTGKRVVMVVGVWQGIWVAGSGTYMDDVVTRLGLVNAVTLSGWVAVSSLQILEWDPDIVLIVDEYATNETLAEAGLNHPRIVFLDKKGIDSLSRPGPLILEAPAAIYTAVASVIPLSPPLETEATSAIPPLQSQPETAAASTIPSSPPEPSYAVLVVLAVAALAVLAVVVVFLSAKRFKTRLPSGAQAVNAYS